MIFPFLLFSAVYDDLAVTVCAPKYPQIRLAVEEHIVKRPVQVHGFLVQGHGCGDMPTLVRRPPAAPRSSRR